MGCHHGGEPDQRVRHGGRGQAKARSRSDLPDGVRELTGVPPRLVDHIAYSAAKGGIVGLVRALARALAPKVLVNGLAPGIILTGMPEHMLEYPSGASACVRRPPSSASGSRARSPP